MRLQMKPHNQPGYLFVFCGLDGSGKTTQITLLREFFRRINMDISITKQPTDAVRSSPIFRTYMDSPDHSMYDCLLYTSDPAREIKSFILGSSRSAYFIFIARSDTKEREITSYKLNLFLSDLAMKMKYADLEDPKMKDFISLAGSVNPFFDVLTYTTGFVTALLNVSGFAAIIMTIHPIVFLFLGLVVLTQIIIERKMREYQGGWRQETGPIFRRRNYLADMARCV